MNTPENPCPRHPDVAATAALASEGPPRASVDCAACIDVWNRVKGLRDLGQQQSWDDPDAERVSQMREAIIDALRVAPASHRLAPRQWTTALRHWGLRAVAAASVASIAALVVTRYQHRVQTGAPFVPASLAIIRARGSAHFQQVRRPPDEEVHVTDGKVHVAVVHLDHDQRFRIVTADATVEVRGTEFDVEVMDDRLRSVDVSRGKVEVRVPEHDTVSLTPGLHWETERTRAAQLSPPPAPPPPEPIGSVPEIPSNRRPHQHPEPAEPRNILSPPPALEASSAPPARIESPIPVGGARPAASVIEVPSRAGQPSPPAPVLAPSVQDVANVASARTEQKQNRQDERLDRRQERREERRELREERLQHRR